MERTGVFFFEWVIMRLLWAPWNLLLGIVWAIADDVSEDVAFAHFAFGLSGSLTLIVGFGALWWAPQIGIEMFWLACVCAVLYIGFAFVLKMACADRRMHIFSLPRR